MAKQKTVYNVIIAACALVFCISAGLLGYNLLQYKKGNDEYKQITHQYILENPENAFEREFDWDALKAANKDTVGWVYIPDSKIDYPVVQGKDNEYYLTKTFSDNDNKLGAIFMDHLNQRTLTDDNTIIYGHHMRDGSMFKGLVEYKSQEYYQSHPLAYYYTPDGKTYEIQLFSAFTVNKDDDYTMIMMGSKKAELFQTFQKRSNFKSDVQLSESDRIMSFSTCTYDYDDARYVLQGKIVEKTKEPEKKQSDESTKL